MKKLLFITILLFSVTLFAQQKNVNGTINGNTEQIKSINNIAAYPNPFATKTQINFTSSKEQEIDFSVKNMLGKTIFYERIQTKKGFNTIKFYRNTLTKGMYIYTLQTSEELVSKRLVIK